MTKSAPLFLALVLFATLEARALVSQEDSANVPESEVHQLQWRPTPSHGWENVGSPQPVTDVTHPSVVGLLRGVDWDLSGTVADFGEWRAFAIRYNLDSPPSNVIDLGVPEPPAAPLMLASLATLAGLVWWRGR